MADSDDAGSSASGEGGGSPAAVKRKAAASPAVAVDSASVPPRDHKRQRREDLSGEEDNDVDSGADSNASDGGDDDGGDAGSMFGNSDSDGGDDTNDAGGANSGDDGADASSDAGATEATSGAGAPADGGGSGSGSGSGSGAANVKDVRTRRATSKKKRKKKKPRKPKPGDEEEEAKGAPAGRDDDRADDDGGSDGSDNDNGSGSDTGSAAAAAKKKQQQRKLKLAERRKRRQASAKNRYIEEEAEVSDDDQDGSGDEDEDEDGAAADLEGFIQADDVKEKQEVDLDSSGSDDDSDHSDSDGSEDSDGSDDDSDAPTRRRNVLKKAAILDEDDKALVAEASGRMAPRAVDEAALHRQLFDDGDNAADAEDQPVLPRKQRPTHDDDSDSFHSFIEDDNDDDGDDLGPSIQLSNMVGNATREQLMLAAEVFGPGFHSMFDDAAPEADGEEWDLLDSTTFSKLTGAKAQLGPKEQDVVGARASDKTMERIRGLRKRFEPAELERMFLTEFDESVRVADVPERLQFILPARVRSLIETAGADADAGDAVNESKEQRSEEAEWIGSRLAFFRHESYNPEQVIKSVANVLEFVFDDMLEVPFIWLYKKDFVAPLRLRHLWKVVDLDKTYIGMQRTKRALSRLLDAIPDSSVALQHELRDLLMLAHEEDNVKDTAAYIRMVLAARPDLSRLSDKITDDAVVDMDSDAEDADGDAKMSSAAARKKPSRPAAAGRPSQRSAYAICVRNGVGAVREKLALSAHEVQQNIRRLALGQALVHVPRDPEESPEEVAQALCDDSIHYATPASVLQAARYMAAAEIAEHPVVLQICREKWNRFATISTTPTQRGKEEIDTFHDYFGLHTLVNKPVSAFGTFLQPQRPPITRQLDETDKVNMQDDTYPPLASDDAKVKNEWHTGFGTDHMEQENEDGGWDYVEGVFPEVRPGRVGGNARLPPRVGGRAQALVLFRAEKEGLLKVQVNAPTEELEREILPAFLSTAGVVATSDDERSAWDRQRVAIVQHAVRRILVPKFTAELRKKLRTDASEAVAEEYARALRRRALLAPWPTVGDRPEQGDPLSGTRKSAVPNVLAVGLSDEGRLADYVITLDGDGKVTAQEELPHSRDPNALIEQFVNMLDIGEVDVVVINPGTRASERMMRQAQEAVAEYERRVAEAGSPLPGRIAVVLGDADVAGAYIHSERAESEFTGTTAPFRTAVAIGRFHQDALRELCSMWQLHGRSAHSTDLRAAGVASLGDDLLALTLHPLQSEVTPTQLLKGAERVMVETVNAVGVDINQALAHDHVAPMLQFLCGMGPRKATDLVQKLGKFKQVARDDLRADGNVGERVYRNLAGFVWIAPNRARRDVHALENTRIHPELYEHAKTICSNVVDTLWKKVQSKVAQTLGPTPIDATATVLNKRRKKERELTASYTQRTFSLSIRPMEDDDMYAEVRAGCRRAIRHRRKRDDRWTLDDGEEPKDGLATLYLDGFAQDLEKEGKPGLRTVLQLIKEELRVPFRDPRRAFAPPTPAAEFRMLTGETRERVREGIITTGTVVYISDYSLDMEGRPRSQMMRLRLASGLMGFCPAQNASDMDTRGVDLGSMFTKGQALACRIARAQPDRKTVVVSCRQSDVDGPPPPVLVDAFCDFLAAQEFERVMREFAKRAAAAGDTADDRVEMRFQRPIGHSAFKNFNREEAEAYLQDKPRFEAIVRPKGTSLEQVTLTWKYRDGMYAHYPIVESDKDEAKPMLLGNTLSIYQRQFEDLDEIFATFIDPMSQFARDLEDYPKYRDQPTAQVDEKIKELKRTNPKSIPYLISPHHSRPCFYVLCYQPRTTVRHEYIKVSASGLRWRDKTFAKPERLIRYFKAHYRDPIPQAQQAAPPRASAGAGRGAGAGSTARDRDGDVSMGVGAQPPPPPTANYIPPAGMPPGFAFPPPGQGMPPGFPPGMPPGFQPGYGGVGAASAGGVPSLPPPPPPGFGGGALQPPPPPPAGYGGGQPGFGGPPQPGYGDPRQFGQQGQQGGPYPPSGYPQAPPPQPRTTSRWGQ